MVLLGNFVQGHCILFRQKHSVNVVNGIYFKKNFLKALQQPQPLTTNLVQATAYTLYWSNSGWNDGRQTEPPPPDQDPYNHLVLFQEKLKNDSKTVNMHRIESEIGYVL